MRRAAFVLALSVSFACGDSSDTARPTGPSSIADTGVTAAAEARSVIRVPGDFATIQAAIDAAEPGDTVQVGAGTYCENVVITKSDLRLRTTPGTRAAVIDGTCVGGLGAGIHVMGKTGVEITGFIIQHFEWGIFVHSTTASLIHLNEARLNNTVVRAGVPAQSRGFGILLEGSGFNTVSQNDLHDNRRNGIVLRGTSTGNIVRANHLKDNNRDGGGCNLMVAGTASDNSIVENEVVGALGSGIMIGPGLATGNRVAQNRVHGFAGPGILLMASTVGNVIEQNDARGNGQTYSLPQNVDLFDFNAAGANTWSRNLGTCGPGVC